MMHPYSDRMMTARSRGMTVRPSGDVFSDFVSPIARQGAAGARTPEVIGQVSDGVVTRLMAAGAVQQIADAVVPRLLADTAFQTRVGTAAGNAAVASLKTPAMIAAGALAVGALALVWMAATRPTRSNPSRRSYR